MKLRPTGARDLSSAGLAKEDGLGKIARKRASYMIHRPVHVLLWTTKVKLYERAKEEIAGPFPGNRREDK
jgi:hypothetical protein